MKKYTQSEIEFIKNNYKNMSNSEIGKNLNISMEAVRKKLKRLELKKSSEDIKNNYQNNKHKCSHHGNDHPLFGKHRTEEVKEKIRKKLLGKPCPWNKINLEKYKNEYGSWNKGLSTEEINKHYKNGIHPNTGKTLEPLSNKHKNKISLGNKGKKRSEEMKKKLSESLIKSGARALEKNSNWRGGKSFEIYPREFNKIFKQSIKIRDGFLCLKCGMREEDSKIILKTGLDIHHINYDKKLNMKENACSLCRRCHGETNFNRTSWIKFFQTMMTERYDYQYDKEGTIIINSYTQSENGE